ncbi:PTS sugar transporter subunit IIA [Psychromonas hadalis]|uniref:PTS sugar transporter subunit IIA n=1 Tax=Psychromonas hadalis TaxID=211669 RepID=UPI0003B5CFCF|nr:PTS sugar transporter subunit IIA [Psychromonas hadalis]
MNENLITIDTVILDLEADSRVDALYSICAQLFLLRKTQDPSGLYADIIKREDIVSTFAGQQVAIPHVITRSISEPTLSFVRIKSEDFTWGGDDQDVRIIFLLCVPMQDDLQKIRQSQSYIFSSIAQLMSDTVIMDLWLTTSDQQQILNSLQAAFQSNFSVII